MKGLNIIVIFAYLHLIGYNAALISSWGSWRKSESMCRDEAAMTRTRLHMDPQHRCKYYQRCSMFKSVENETLPNIALNQPATMSSKYQDYGAELITDGGILTDMFFGSCAQTKMDSSPWIRIDLGSNEYISYVEEIIIFNRFDCCSSRANNLSITVGDDPTGQNNSLCNVQENMNLELVRILCHQRIFGRYIHVRVPGPQILHLCEVQALGGRYKNLALGKSVIASSEDSTRPLARLTDGNLNEYTENTGIDQNPWMRIDLGQVVQVHLIRLYIGRHARYIENSIVSVGYHFASNTMVFCGVVLKSNKMSGTKESYIVKCTQKGSHVQINLIVKSNDFLSISEVEVLGDL